MSEGNNERKVTRHSLDGAHIEEIEFISSWDGTHRVSTLLVLSDGKRFMLGSPGLISETVIKSRKP